jgi:hypothetical protein
MIEHAGAAAGIVVAHDLAFRLVIKEHAWRLPFP